MTDKSASANTVTREILLAIPSRFPGARCWRQNVGQAVPMGIIRQAVGLLRMGRIKEAIDLLLGRPVRFGVPGMADVSGIVAGRRLEVEIKVGRDKQSDEQISFQRMIEAAGGIYIIAPDAEGALDEIARRVAEK